MQTMIKEYERGRVLLSKRIRELNSQLTADELGNKERDKLTLRRDLLVAERIDMLHAIVSMQAHRHIGEECTCQEP